MTDRIARRLAWSAFLLYVLFFGATVYFNLATSPGEGNEGDILWPLMTSTFSIVAILILA